MLIALLFTGCSSTSSASGTTNVRSQPLASDADTIPCAPRAVLVAVCQQCHTRPPRNGAPFALVNRSDIVSDDAIRLDMIAQLESEHMPLPPVTIEDTDRAVLLEWLEGGAPAVPATSCERNDR